MVVQLVACWDQSKSYSILLEFVNIIIIIIIIHNSGKGNTISVQAWTGLGGFQKLRLQEFKIIGKYRPPLPPRKYSW